VKKRKNSSYDSDFSEAEDSKYLYQKDFKRHCCIAHKINDHSKPDWRPQFEWVRNDVTIPGKKRKLTQEDNKELNKARVLKSL